MSGITSFLMPKQPKPPAPTAPPNSNDPKVDEAKRREAIAAQMAMGRSALDITRGTGGSSSPVLKQQLGA